VAWEEPESLELAEEERLEVSEERPGAVTLEPDLSKACESCEQAIHTRDCQQWL
jgi:hypothetical protein